MQSVQALRPTPEFAERLIFHELDLKPMLEQCRKDYQWTAEQAEEAELWYRRHLWLCFQFPDQPISVLSKKADQLWHQHIIDTNRYREDCNRIFGAFLNHVPFYAEQTVLVEDTSFDDTLDLYRRLYGHIPPDVEKTSVKPPYSPNAEPAAPPPAPPDREGSQASDLASEHD
jgi:hypothetical protein